MFLFLLAPRYFMNSPVAQWELAHLRRRSQKRSKILRILDVLLVLGCIWVATIPLRIYVVHETRQWLFLMMFVIMGLHFAVGLRTLVLATNSLRENTPGKWDSYVLTGLSAPQIVLGKWWAVVRYTLWSHVFVAFMRLSLALAYAQYMHKEFSTYTCPLGGKAFCYYSWTGIDNFPADYPNYNKILLGLLIILIFALLETGLLASFGIFSTFSTRSHRYLRLPTAIFLRISLLVIAIVSIFATEFNNKLFAEPIRNYANYNNWQARQDTLFLLETIEIGLSAFGDNGTLISTVIMRPYTGYISKNYENIFLPLRMTFGSGLIAAICYLFLIWFMLRLSQLFAIRQKALPAEIFKR